MNTAYANTQEFSPFSEASLKFNTLIKALSNKELANVEHGKVEQHIFNQGFEVLRCLFQGYLDKISKEEVIQPSVLNINNERLSNRRKGSSRQLTTLFGEVTVSRISYSSPAKKSFFPLDNQLNLARRKFSDGVQHRVTVEASKGSFDEATKSINDTTAASIAKRQSLQIVQDTAKDFDAYYAQNRYVKEENTTDLLVISGDGKGIVMRPDSLRECTKRKILKGQKIGSRLSQGEKKDRKRMAQVASVYTVLPHIRTADSIMQSPTEKDENIKQFRPVARNKRVWASVEKEAKEVIRESFLEALQRDPKQKRQWVVVVDGQPSQLIAINKIMTELNVKATIIIDFIHVLEYVWSAAWCFFKKGSQEAEKWVAKQSLKILRGEAAQVVKGMRIKATKNKLKKRQSVDKCAKYLLKNKSWLAYDKALEQGFPIASGIIEGACRHLLNDRLDITGARWSLDGAEAIVKLRSIRSSGDFDSYWEFHKQQEKLRNYCPNNLEKSF